MADGRFLIAGGGCIGFSFMLFAVLRFSLESLQKATTQEGIEWMYFIHIVSEIIGVILLIIGIFKKESSA
ncbi:MAG: hypothetical protein KGH87_06550 [Thaumarchaeota archaeon]|nr:hypothetical protein [Nitrososphaerota archaeon]